MNFDGIKVTHWHFEDVGDTIPMHVHESGDMHISILVQGSVHVQGEDWELTLNEPGKIANFVAGQPHEFKALAVDSIVCNIAKRIQPDDDPGTGLVGIKESP